MSNQESVSRYLENYYASCEADLAKAQADGDETAVEFISGEMQAIELISEHIEDMAGDE